jgi:hypothetical protein
VLGVSGDPDVGQQRLQVHLVRGPGHQSGGLGPPSALSGDAHLPIARGNEEARHWPCNGWAFG